jgi:hypothetical protein
MATPLVIVFWETVSALDKKRSFPVGSSYPEFSQQGQ